MVPRLSVYTTMRQNEFIARLWPRHAVPTAEFHLRDRVWLPQRSHYDTCRYIVDHACNSTMSRPGAWDGEWGQLDRALL